MEPLLETLTQYAEENLVVRLLRENIPQIRAARVRAEQLTNQLKATNPEAEKQVEKLEIALNNIFPVGSRPFCCPASP